MRCLKCLLSIKTSIGNYGMHSQCFAKWFKVPDSAQFLDLTRESASNLSAESSDITPQNNSFFHGKFKKYSALLNGRLFILKMRQDDAPEFPAVEYLCNQIGAELGVPVAKFYLINFESELVLVTENFIHNSTVPMDVQNIYHFRNSKQHNCKDLIEIVHKYTKQPYYVQILMGTILFDSLVGNHDRHGRNLAFVVMPNNIVLAPIYDNVSYLGLESGNMLKADFNPKGKIATSLTDEPSMVDYVIELCTLGFTKEVLGFYKEIKPMKIEKLIEQSFCSPLMQQGLQKLINKRYTELANACKSYT